MKKNREIKYGYFVFLFFIACHTSKGEMSKHERECYLQEHVGNSNYLISKNLSQIEWYKLVYKKDTAYIDKFKKPIEECRAFVDLLNEVYKANTEIDKLRWNDIKDKNDTVFYSIQKISPPFFRKKLSLPLLEQAESTDSEELKLAKYYSNCQRMCHYIIELLRLSENPLNGIVTKKHRIFDMQYSADTITVGNDLIAAASPAIFFDVEPYTCIKKTQDIKIDEINPKTGRFKILITGNHPSIVITVFDTRNLKAIDHEVVF